jgi:D-alanyl-D-alanine carboxypeptidase/D-alanyl-D-alanine-endopeptidase (penicillin-binding protein 4)
MSFSTRSIQLAVMTVALVSSLVAPAAAVGTTPSPSPTESPVANGPSPSPSLTSSPIVSPTPIPYLPLAPNSCSAKTALAQSALGKFYAYVVDVTTGRVLLDINGDQATPSASVLKVLSVSAALTYLPATYSTSTKVFTVPSEPGTIVLKGGGDHTLSQMTKDSYTTYAKPSRLETLANKVLTGWNSDKSITKIILDSSFFSGESYNQYWLSTDRTNGYISHITALQVDSDRANGDQTSPYYSGYRSTDPVLKTGTLFKAALKGLAPNAKLVKGITPKGAVELTSVSSQPITTWMAHAIGISDNTETEFIARHAAKAFGLAPAFTSVEPMVKSMLSGLGIDSTQLVMKDASGLAQADRVTPKLITELMQKVAQGNNAIAPLENYLPVAGVGPGSMGGRFTGANAIARNFVKGKTGFIPGLYSLAGIISAKDGSRLAYSIFARSADGKKVGWSTRGALDTVATRFYTCGAGLTY